MTVDVMEVRRLHEEYRRVDMDALSKAMALGEAIAFLKAEWKDQKRGNIENFYKDIEKHCGVPVSTANMVVGLDKYKDEIEQMRQENPNLTLQMARDQTKRGYLKEWNLTHPKTKGPAREQTPALVAARAKKEQIEKDKKDVREREIAVDNELREAEKDAKVILTPIQKIEGLLKIPKIEIKSVRRTSTQIILEYAFQEEMNQEMLEMLELFGAHEPDEDLLTPEEEDERSKEMRELEQNAIIVRAGRVKIEKQDAETMKTMKPGQKRLVVCQAEEVKPTTEESKPK